MVWHPARAFRRCPLSLHPYVGVGGRHAELLSPEDKAGTMEQLKFAILRHAPSRICERGVLPIVRPVQRHLQTRRDPPTRGIERRAPISTSKMRRTFKERSCPSNVQHIVGAVMAQSRRQTRSTIRRASANVVDTMMIQSEPNKRFLGQPERWSRLLLIGTLEKNSCSDVLRLVFPMVSYNGVQREHMKEKTPSEVDRRETLLL